MKVLRVRKKVPRPTVTKETFLVLMLLLIAYTWIKAKPFFTANPKTAALGLAALLVGYFSGLVAVFMGVLYAFFIFLLSLPFVGFIYAFLIYYISRIHFMLAKIGLEKALNRSKRYKRFKLKVKNSEQYRKLRSNTNKVFKKAGLTDPHAMRFIEVKMCRACKQEEPAFAKYCPHCGEKQ